MLALLDAYSFASEEGKMTPEEMLRELYRYIDKCFEDGMELGEVLGNIESYIATLDH